MDNLVVDLGIVKSVVTGAGAEMKRVVSQVVAILGVVDIPVVDIGVVKRVVSRVVDVGVVK